MFAAGKTAGASSGSTIDAQFNYVTMLLHGDGTNGAQNNTFIDSSSTGATVTRSGATTQGSFSPYGSNWSNYIDGSSYLAISNGGGSALDMGTGNCTIEMWVNPDTQTTSFPSMFAPSSAWSTGTFYIRYSNTAYSNKFGIFWNSVGDPFFSSTNTYPSNAWYHVALVRNGTTFTLYVNGVADGTGTSSASLNLAIGGSVWLGNNGSASCNFKGYLSNVRVVKGTAVYTSNFTPSTTPLTAISGTSLLTCQSNRFIDTSASPLTITTSGTPSVQRFNPFGASTAYSTSVIGGSGYFDGSSQLSFSTNAGYAFGTGDFTAECFYYATSNPGYRSLIETRASNGTSNGWALAADSGGTMYVYAAGFILTGISVVLNTWNHVAFTRSGSTQYLFLNGVLVSSTATARTYSDTNLGVGGVAYTTGEYWTGYLSNVRLIKGTCLYTTTFTPPTAPLTAVTNTTLLLNTSNAGIFDNAMMNNLTTVGNAQISTSVYKYGTGSLYFDGNGDNLSSPATPDLNMTTGNWTIECWVYISSRTLNYPLIFGNNNGGYSAGALAITNSNADSVSYNDKFFLAFYDVGTFVASGPTNSLNTWYHLAVVRNGTNISMYRDGSSVISTTISSSVNFDWGKLGNRIGGGNWDGAQSYFNGYIDDLRVTKGYARYTTTFTPPTAAFPNIGPV